uniref:Uncharacterized protein n=1 Tax=viral metagenome TaxID=1070528 RepID=A0A6C0C8L3_9ZZZZ
MDTTKIRKFAQAELEIIKNNEKKRQSEKKNIVKVPQDLKNNFDLNNFLESYVPKSSENALKGCLCDKRLQGYQILSKKNMKDLIAGKTYIKYIKNGIGYDMKLLQTGGIFVAGGMSQKNGFKHTEIPEEWTHLMLKLRKGEEEDDAHVFVVKILNFYIFYKLFDEVLNNNTIRDIMVKLQNSDMDTAIPTHVKLKRNTK